MFQEEDYIELSTSKLLASVGYEEIDIRCFYAEDEPGKGEVWYPKITLYEAQRWLRNVHNLCVEIHRNASGFFWSICKADYGTFITDYKMKGPNDGGCWDNYEAALNAGIYRACQMIKERKA